MFQGIHRHIRSTLTDSISTGVKCPKLHQLLGQKYVREERTKDSMIKYSMTMNATFLQKLEILSYAMEAKYISVEVLLKILLRSTSWFPNM